MRKGFQSGTPCAVAFTALLTAGPVVAQTSPPASVPAPTVARPAWAVAPSVDFPPYASSVGIDQARVVLDCRTNSDLALVDCTIQSETPPGFGFGEAALASVGAARLVPSSDLEAIYRFALAFRLEQTPIPPREN
jgi:hypothetical protein